MNNIDNIDKSVIFVFLFFKKDKMYRFYVTYQFLE